MSKELKVPCLILDHDDTTVNSTATVHYPAFAAYMKKFHPDVRITLEEYFRYNFEPGVIPFFTQICGMTEAELPEEEAFWYEYVQHHIPQAYPGIREIIEEQQARGGKVEQRKPAVWPLEQIMKTYGFRPEELLMVDDLKPGYDMAKAAGVPFAAAGWANDIPEIEQFMRNNCGLYFKTVAGLSEYLFN